MNIKHCIVGALRFFRILPHVHVEGYWADYETGRVHLGVPEVDAWFRSLDEAEDFADAIVHDDPEGPGFAIVAAVFGFGLCGYKAEVVYETCLAGTCAEWSDSGLRLVASA